LDVYRTEEEQVEAIRKWWQENGKSIVFGVILGLGAIYGWRSWTQYQIEQAQAASGLYQNVLVALRSDSPAEARAPAGEIVKNYAGTGYAVLARLVLAKLAVDADDLEQAAEHLQQARSLNDSVSLEPAIRLRLARVYAAREDYAQALAQLDTKARGEYGPSFDELRGDILAARGDDQAALEAYREALAAARERSADTSVLEMKMDDLGVANRG
jgi:predicted negative regulator of RcsB-dependent stress response